MDILHKISDCILNMEEEQIVPLVRQSIEVEKIPFHEIYEHGLNAGMVRAIACFEQKEYDIPEIIVCADTLKKGLDILGDYGAVNAQSKGKILLAVVEGDTHEIGKNIVKIMLEAAGYEVIDLGVNQSAVSIIEAAQQQEVNIIGLSSMMSTTRGEMKKVIDIIRAMPSDSQPLVMIGGGSVTSGYATDIQADGYATNAPNTVKMVQKLLKERRA